MKQQLDELSQSIKNFEDLHKDYDLFEEDGSLTTEGWDLLHDAEVNWADDIKWNDYTKFHLRSRIAEYWYGNGEQSDIDYYNAWLEIHPQ